MGTKFADRVLLQRRAWSKAGHLIYVILRAIILLGICYYILYPFIEGALRTFMAREDILDSTVGFIPVNWTLDNLKIVLKASDFLQSISGTAIMTLTVTVTQVISCTLVGYGFARFDIPAKKLLFGLVIFTLVVPAQTIIVPMYLNFWRFDPLGIIRLFGGKPLNLLESPWPFVVLGITCTGLKNGLYIYLIRQYYRNVPKELEEAAMIDGAGAFKTFYSIMLPSAKPILFTVAIFSFVWQWTDSFYISWFYKDMPSLAVSLSSISGSNYVIQTIGGGAALEQNYASLINTTGAILLVLPLVIIYIFSQRMLVQGIERGGIVG